MDLEIIILGVSCATLGVNVFALFMVFIDKHKVRYQYLGVFFVAHLISVLDDIYELSDGWVLIPELYNVYLPFIFLILPAFYLYLQTLVHPELHKKFKYKSIHWTGFLVVLILCLPYFLLDSTIKLERLSAPSGTLEHLGMITIGPFIALLLFIPFSLVYMLLGLRLIAKNQINIKSFFSNIENKNLSWIRWMLILLMLALIFSALHLFLPDALTDLWTWQFVYMLLGFCWLTLFIGLASKQKPILIVSTHNKKQAEQNSNGDKYHKSKLNEIEAERIQEQLIHAMQVTKLHEKPGLTLRDLADEMGISQNKISQVLNTHLKKGFYDFINGWRIKEACEILKHQSKSIIEVAYEVGFNSKSTFNTSFKKHTGLTPSQYKKVNRIT